MPRSDAVVVDRGRLAARALIDCDGTAVACGRPAVRVEDLAYVLPAAGGNTSTTTPCH